MVTQNFEALKAVMDHFDVDAFTSEKINEFLPFYKESISMRKNIPQLFRPPFIVMDWMTGLLELKIKKEFLSFIARKIEKVFKFKNLLILKPIFKKR